MKGSKEFRRAFRGFSALEFQCEDALHCEVCSFKTACCKPCGSQEWKDLLHADVPSGSIRGLILRSGMQDIETYCDWKESHGGCEDCRYTNEDKCMLMLPPVDNRSALEQIAVDIANDMKGGK